MKAFKKTKLILTALFLGLPISSVFVDNNQEANAAIRPSTMNKIGNTVKPILTKPPIPPKPTNIPRVPSQIAKRINKFNNLQTSGIKQSSFVSNNKNNNPTPITQKVQKLNLNADFEKQLNGIFSNKNSFNNKFNSKPSSKTPTPNKLNPEVSQKLEGIFGNKNTTTTTNPITTPQTPSNSFVNNNPNIPDAPPLPGATQNSLSAIPPAPPLPTKKPLNNQTSLNNKLSPKTNSNSNLNSDNNQQHSINKKPLSRVTSSDQESLMMELQKKLSSRKK